MTSTYGRALPTTIKGSTRSFDEAEAFHRRALPQVFQKPPQRFPSRSLYEDLITQSASMVFVAERKSQLVGFLVIRVSESPDEPMLAKRRFAMVDMVAVQTDQQHLGIGQALMEVAHSWASRKHLTEVMLTVWEFNRRAIGFYEALGYETESRLMSRSL
jgi:diamine N-acetyltransferase